MEFFDEHHMLKFIAVGEFKGSELIGAIIINYQNIVIGVEVAQVPSPFVAIEPADGIVIVYIYSAKSRFALRFELDFSNGLFGEDVAPGASAFDFYCRKSKSNTLMRALLRLDKYT